MNLREQIENYIPFNEQEMTDKKYILEFMDAFDDVLTRENIFGHFTASAFVINKSRDKMVVVYHIINDGWIYPGGHVDGENNLLSVALREVEEETGLKVKILDDRIYAIQVNPVQSHIKNGKFVSAHTHFDVIYIMEADDAVPLKYREDECKGVKWISLEEANKGGIVPFIIPIHKKLIKKIKQLKKYNRLLCYN